MGSKNTKRAMPTEDFTHLQPAAADALSWDDVLGRAIDAWVGTAVAATLRTSDETVVNLTHLDGRRIADALALESDLAAGWIEIDGKSEAAGAVDELRVWQVDARAADGHTYRHLHIQYGKTDSQFYAEEFAAYIQRFTPDLPTGIHRHVVTRSTEPPNAAPAASSGSSSSSS
jgi:hypothetical protein